MQTVMDTMKAWQRAMAPEWAWTIFGFIMLTVAIVMLVKDWDYYKFYILNLFNDKEL